WNFAGAILIGPRMRPSSKNFISRSSRTQNRNHMQKPLRFLPNTNAAAAVVAKFGQRGCPLGLGYATVRDYCESVDELPQIAPTDGDQKNVQRPWAAKTIVVYTPARARLL